MSLTAAIVAGVRLWKQGRHQEALAHFEGLAKRAPGNHAIRYHAGLALKDLGRLAEAEAAFLAAARLNPMRPEPHIALANLWRELGRTDEAILGYLRAMALDPSSPAAPQNLALVLHYDPRADGVDLKRAAMDWARRVEGGNAPAAIPVRNPDPGRRLRVGFLSPDFRRHSCAFFMEPLFRHLSPEAVETFAYADVWTPDGTTRRFESLCSHFADVSRDTLEALAERIRGDGLDILVDLAGHSGNNRLAVFAHRLAPVQATWLGCPGTTGLRAMDARLTDAWADPPGDSESHHTERLVRLAPPFLCFAPSPDAPEVSPLPSLGEEPFTFGSFNSFAKCSEGTVALWARILHAVPGARLFLKDRAMAEPAYQGWVRERFRAHGVAPERILCAGWRMSDADHYGAYGHMDLALDPFPYNGTTTTCEALWMGVPVVTLAGRRHSGRVGVSLLSALGMEAFIAADEEAYLATAVALARDPARLADLRAGLRPRMAASPLCDGPRFAAAFEGALRDLWRATLAGSPAP